MSLDIHDKNNTKERRYLAAWIKDAREVNAYNAKNNLPVATF